MPAHVACHVRTTPRPPPSLPPPPATHPTHLPHPYSAEGRGVVGWEGGEEWLGGWGEWWRAPPKCTHHTHTSPTHHHPPGLSHPILHHSRVSHVPWDRAGGWGGMLSCFPPALHAPALPCTSCATVAALHNTDPTITTTHTPLPPHPPPQPCVTRSLGPVWWVGWGVAVLSTCPAGPCTSCTSCATMAALNYTLPTHPSHLASPTPSSTTAVCHSFFRMGVMGGMGCCRAFYLSCTPLHILRFLRHCGCPAPTPYPPTHHLASPTPSSTTDVCPAFFRMGEVGGVRWCRAFHPPCTPLHILHRRALPCATVAPPCSPTPPKCPIHLASPTPSSTTDVCHTSFRRGGWVGVGSGRAFHPSCTPPTPPPCATVAPNQPHAPPPPPLSEPTTAGLPMGEGGAGGWVGVGGWWRWVVEVGGWVA